MELNILLFTLNRQQVTNRNILFDKKNHCEIEVLSPAL